LPTLIKSFIKFFIGTGNGYLAISLILIPLINGSLIIKCLTKSIIMTKADLVKNISDKTGMDKSDVQMIAEKFMNEVKNSLKNNENVYIRGFGSFIVKTRAEKTGRNISKNVAVVIPAHNIPAFKPSKTFVNSVKQNVPIV
jgi:DNA-binding protein HU-beta